MSKHSENRLHEALHAHLHEEGHPFDRLDGLEIRAITDNGDLPAGGRVVYRYARTHVEAIMLAAPLAAPGAAEPPQVRSHFGV